MTPAPRLGRWGPASPSDDEECRQLILKAAVKCFDAAGPMRATVDDIAQVASVHRTTVYKYFPNRSAIISAVLLFEAQDLIAEAATFYERPAPFVEQFANAYSHVVHGVRESLLLRRLFDPDAVDTVVHATGASEEFRNLVSGSLRPLVALAAERGELRVGLDVDEAIEWLGSIALLLLGESFRDDGFDATEAMRRYILPGIST